MLKGEENSQLRMANWLAGSFGRLPVLIDSPVIGLTLLTKNVYPRNFSSRIWLVIYNEFNKGYFGNWVYLGIPNNAIICFQEWPPNNRFPCSAQLPMPKAVFIESAIYTQYWPSASSRLLNIGCQVLFLCFLRTEMKSRSIKKQKRTRPISSHMESLAKQLGQ